MNGIRFIKILMRGVGQVIFLNNALSGLLLLIGIAFNSLTMCLFAFLGTAISTLTAQLLKYEPAKIENGLYGFNGTLVGIAIPCFLPLNVWSVGVLIIGSALSTWVADMLGKQKAVPGLTAPFVFTTWAILLLAMACPPLQTGQTAASVSENVLAPWKAFSLGFGQIMLQGGSLLTGWLFLLGIAVCSPKMALRAVIPCALSLLLVALPFMDKAAVNQGLFGYNSILAFLAVTDVVSVSSSRYTKAFAALLLAMLFQYIGLYVGMVTLTAPFVLSVWVVVLYDQLTARPSSPSGQ